MDTRDGVTACNTVRLGGPESLPAFFARAKIYFPLSLLALMDVWDNLSRIFRDKGTKGGTIEWRVCFMVK